MTATIALAAVASASATTGHAIHRRTVGFAIGTRYFGSHASLGKQPGFAAAIDPRGGLDFGSALVGSAPTGNGPSNLAVNPATHTLYVANGFNENGNAVGGSTVSVLDTRRCRAHDLSRCEGPWPTLTAGRDPNADPSAVAIDQQTDTLYVADSNDNTVSVFNGASCNAENTSGCGQTPATVPVGMVPVAIFDDPVDHTVYIPNGGEDDVSMLDTATCNATDLAACPTTPPATVTLPGLATAGDVDQTTHTAYVTVCANNPQAGCPPGTDGVAVFDTSTCNAAAQSGCDQLGALDDGGRPLVGAKVDTTNDTLYTANGDSTISAFDLRRCNASDLAGCATDTPGTLTFPGPGFEVALWVAVDPALHTVYVTYQKDDSVVVVDTNACNGSEPSGCATLSPPTIHTGSDPEIVSLDPATQTLYVANQIDNDVSVIDPTRCDAQTSSGCRQRVPEVRIGSGGLAADPAVATTYVATGMNSVSSGADTVSMINTTECNAFHANGCSKAAQAVTAGTNPDAAAVDRATHTLYVADFGAGPTGTVTVFDDRTCNATDHAGCAATSTLSVPGGNPVDIAVNPHTDTIYVATVTSDGGPNLISVFNGATCNANVSTGCLQTPANVPTGNDGEPFGSTEAVAINSTTNTVYVTSDTLGNPFVGDRVYVIDGATCDAADTSGCGQPPATVTLNPIPSNPFGIPGQEPNPFGIAVDQATDTIYTANIANGEGPGTVSVINGAACNRQNTSGCGQTPATAAAGFGAAAIAVDQLTNQVYATNAEDSSVTTINGNTCNGANKAGCERTQTQAIVGDYPGAITVDPFIGTAYVADGDGVSVFPLIP
jgi:DNA-binding beta-propeller fold protein YncE